MDVPRDLLKASDVTDDQALPCWRASDDSVTCPVVERDAASQPIIAAPGGEAVFPMVKRDDCSEVADGEIQCAKPSIVARQGGDGSGVNPNGEVGNVGAILPPYGIF